MNGELILDLQNVTVPSRRDAEIASIRGVNWSVRAAEFWVVGGLQGGGKSDLIFMLAGLTKPVHGSYKLFDQDMAQHFSDEFLPSRLRVGIVFDDARLLTHLTIAQNVALPARYHHNLHGDEALSWAEALMRETEIGEFASNTPSVLGRHWRRRAALARALALKPDVLLLENPLRGLDWRHSDWWVDFVQKLWRGHDLMSGKPMTIVATADEFRPWRNSGAHFAVLRAAEFETIGAAAPNDEMRMTQAAVPEGI